MDLLVMSIATACIILSLHSKLLYLFNTFCDTFYANTTPAWRVETMFPVVVRAATSAFMAFILTRMLALTVRAMRELLGGARRAKKKAPPVYIYPRVRLYNGILPTPRCVICLCEGSNNAVLECGHAFHWACVRPWLDRRNTCPLCMRVQGRRAVGGGRVVMG